MNLFIHGRLHHFMAETDGEGSDLGGADDSADEQDDAEGDQDDSDDSSEEDDDEDHVIVTIGDEKPPVEDEEEKTAPKWVKDLRKQTKEQAKRIRELEQEAAAKAAPAVKAPELGPKPTLEDCDWDAETFEQKLDEWKERKLKIDKAAEDEQKQKEAQQQEWQGRLSTYAKAKEGLKVRDFDDAESTVLSTLSVTQQGIIVQGADNSALVVYALGKNPDKAKELAGITDAVKFAFAIAKLETQLKVQAKSKSAPAPEGKVRGSAPVSGSVDSNLERLRAEAEKTGDYSKVTQYRRQQKEKQKA
jgi:hypothetical protein